MRVLGSLSRAALMRIRDAKPDEITWSSTGNIDDPKPLEPKPITPGTGVDMEAVRAIAREVEMYYDNIKIENDTMVFEHKGGITLKLKFK